MEKEFEVLMCDHCGFVWYPEELEDQKFPFCRECGCWELHENRMTRKLVETLNKGEEVIE